MRASDDVFHLAIPVYDLDESQNFYVGLLGCKLARRYDDRITLDFFGDQLVCHLTERPSPGASGTETISLYPRHFGITFRHVDDFEAVHSLATARGLPFFAQRCVRFGDRVESHETFVLKDPSGNLIEFKYYSDHRMMY
jgi:extradiol dioxygenase family protein